jgi:hypothetical protein
MVGAAAVANTLVDPATPDYYQFAGKKGDRVIIQATAFGLVTNAPQDGSITDTVVTLYLPDMKTIWAVNDDEWPRLSTDSVLWTELPMDGNYYVTVEDCNALAVNNPSVSCAAAANITTFDYQLFIGDATASKTESVGSATTPTTVTYTPVPKMAGSYYNPTIDGDVAAQADVHVFNFTPPADTKADPSARSRAYFWVQSYGSGDGTGTALDVVLTAKDMANNVLAKADQQWYTNGDDPANNSLEFSFPLDDQFGNKLGSPFKLEVSVSNKTGITPTKNYYIIDHHGGPFWYGSAEAEGPAGTLKNDTAATAEVLASPTGVTGGWFIDGNLSSATDVDWYTFTAPAAAKLAGIDCAAARNGSGIQGFTAELFSDAAGTVSIGKIGPEVTPAKADLNGPTKGITITGGAKLTLKISATGQDGAIKGNYYRCSMSAQ